MWIPFHADGSGLLFSRSKYERSIALLVNTSVWYGLEIEMDNPLSKLALDYWYQVLIVVSVAVFLLTGAGVLKAFPTAATALISLGGFWIGLGEWINHPLQTSFLPPTAYQPGGVLTSHARQAKPIGNIFLLLGLSLVAFGFFRSFR